MATPHDIDTPEIRWFKARYPGRCGECPQEIQPGDIIGQNPNTGAIIRRECCEPAEIDVDAPHRNPNIPVIPVRTSHGRTDLVGKRGCCPECFEIPSSNGACAAHCSRSVA